MSRGNYSATLNNMKLVHWPLMGGLLHLVQRGGDWAGPLWGTCEAGSAAELAASRKEEKYSCHRRPLHIWANPDGVFGRLQYFSSPAPNWPGQKDQGRLESLATSFRDVRCWYNASTPSCYMIVCRSLIAPLHGLMIIPIILPFSFFFKSLGNMSTEGQK